VRHGRPRRGRAGAKLTVAAGFALVVAGLALGTTMTATSGDRFMALWTLVVGAGAGLGFATAASAALVELSAERSGVGSALLQAVIKLGPASARRSWAASSTPHTGAGYRGGPDRAGSRRSGERLRRAHVARQLNSPECSLPSAPPSSPAWTTPCGSPPSSLYGRLARPGLPADASGCTDSRCTSGPDRSGERKLEVNAPWVLRNWR